MPRSLFRFILTSLAVVISITIVLADKFDSINLQPKANQKMTDNFHSDENNGNNLASLSKGEHTLEGVKFKIGEGLIQLGSKVVTNKPNKVEGIKVDERCKKLHILHATGYGQAEPGDANYVADDTLIGQYTINYEDKTKEVIPIVYGKDVRDWWFLEGGSGVSRGKVGWIGDNDATKNAGARIRLYITTWVNPKPGKEIASIDYSSTGTTAAAPFCVAISCEE